MKSFKYPLLILTSVEIEEIEYIYNLRRFGMKLDLSVMRDFAALLGNPQDDVHFAHVAGTNGKGSVCAFLYEIMKRKYRAGIYTSPHVKRYTERIVVNDEEIPEEYIVDFVRKYKATIEKLAKENRNPTFFEVTTALALKYFSEKNVEFAVMEVGLGGRLDATNIITPDITAITSIDKEHTNVLGKSIEKIAKEKAGIIKKGVPVVVGEHKKKATQVIKKIADMRRAMYHNVNQECIYEDLKMEIGGMEFTLKTPKEEYRIKTKMIGRHQIKNVMVAVRMAELLQENYSITKSDIEKGIEETKWRDRFEVKSNEPLMIFDASHNPAGARVLRDTLRDLNLRDVTLLFSMLEDKDVDSYLKKLKGRVNKVIVTEINYYRKMNSEKIKKIAENYFSNVILIKNPCEALRYAINNEEKILATGSIYLLGELESCPL